MCNPCYQRARRTGSITVETGHRGPDAPAWTGERVGYFGMHLRLEARHGKAATYRCSTCPRRADEWALIQDSAAVEDRRTGYRYSTRTEDYTPQCVSCHRRSDAEARASRSAQVTYPTDVLPEVDWSALALCQVLIPWSGDLS